MRTVVAFFCLVSLGTPDEVILKDGKKIEWSTLRDAGDTLEIVTAAGTTVSVAKKDVDRVTVSASASVLTGATFEFDRKKRKLQVDLLRVFDPRKAMDGTMTVSKREIEIKGTVNMVNARFPSTFKPPEEYDISMVVERTQGLGELGVGLVGGGKQFNVLFDLGFASFMNVWGKPKKMGALFEEERRPRHLKFMVRREGLVIQVDGKDYYTVEGWKGVQLHRRLRVPDEGVIFLTAYPGTGWKISRFVLTSPID